MTIGPCSDNLNTKPATDLDDFSLPVLVLVRLLIRRVRVLLVLNGARTWRMWYTSKLTSGPPLD